LRVAAGGYETRDVEVPEGTDVPLVPLSLVARSSLTFTLLPFDTRREVSLEVRLVDQTAREKPRVFDSRRVTLAVGQRSEKVLLENVPPGRYRLQWEGPAVALGEKAVEVAPEKRTDTGTIALQAGKLVEGRVVDDLGSPVEGARIRLSSGAVGDGFARMATTGTDGGFSFSGYPTGEPMKWIASEKSHIRKMGDWSGETRLEIVLERAQTVKGRLVDESGDPVARVRIEPLYLAEDGVTTQYPWNKTTSGEDGAFSFFREFPDLVVLTIDASGFERKRVESPAVVAGTTDDLDLGDIVLSRGRSIRGTVTDAETGAPIPLAQVSGLVDPENEDSVLSSLGPVSAGEDGRYELSGVPGREAPLVLVARSKGYAASTQTVATSAETVDFRLGKGGRIEVRVCGSPAELRSGQMTARLGPFFGSGLSQTSPGLFVGEGLEPGPTTVTWRLSLPVPGGYAYIAKTQDERLVTVEAGKTATASFGCDGVVVSGTMTLLGVPLGGVTFVLEGPAKAIGVTEADGRFQVRVPLEGRFVPEIFGRKPPAGKRFTAGDCDVRAPAASCRFDFTTVDVEPPKKG
ncbi:MAG: carboxypeptidase regulatory-like domain-containing protein, partial [Acidobacteria bacterium]|nr:carboxypeptidase regulatory-like domain-containing protein [Acidobacteriota bacterium]